MINKKRVCTLILLALLASCNANNFSFFGIGKSVQLLSVSEIKQISESPLVKANNEFGLDLFKNLVKEDSGKDVFISPTSAAIALQMLYNGADGETKDEIAKTLKLNDLEIEKVNDLNKLLIRKLQNPAKDIDLKVANSIWADKKFMSLSPSFQKNMSDFYQAEATNLDFKGPETIPTINNWAADNTNNKIKTILKEIDDEVLFLVNALYFKADWKEKFKKSDTKDMVFNISDSETKKHPFINDFREYKYYKQDKFYQDGKLQNHDLKLEVAELPYGKEGKISMYMFLPEDINQLYDNLTEENLETWIKKLGVNDGYIAFPKFKFEYEKKLNDNLKSLGINQAFEPFANLTKLGSSPLGNLYLSYVKQKTFIDVNEEGSEAAAVTVVASSPASSAPSGRFVADKPFVYMIRDNETKTILFMGTVTNPEYEE